MASGSYMICTDGPSTYYLIKSAGGLEAVRLAPWVEGKGKRCAL